jgi:uncharacterized membrane protein
MTNRFNLIVSPFIAFMMAYGIYFIVKNQVINDTHSGRILKMPVFVAVLLALMTFFSSISTGNAQDYDHFPHTSMTDTPYFTRSELESFRFLREKADTTLPLYADYQTRRNDFLLSDFTTRRIIQSGDISYIQNGYLTLRSSELQRKQALTFSPDGFGSATYRYQLDPLNPQEDITANTSAKDRIYTNGDVQVFAIYPGDVP